MAMMKARRNINWEPLCFALIIACSLMPICLIRFVPSMDGPAHLYNANILAQICGGGSFLSNYFVINTVPVPNWLFYLLAAPLIKFLPGYLVEKLILAAYIVTLPLSFRYLIKSYNRDNTPFLAFTIFPLIYSFLFSMGFYNLVLSFPIMFFTIGYWERKCGDLNIKTMAVLAALFLMLYSAHIFALCFCAYIVFVSSSYQIIYLRGKSDGVVLLLKKTAGQWLIALLAFTPSLVVSLIYFTRIHPTISSTKDITTEQRLAMLFSNKPYTIFLLVLILSILCLRTYSYFFRNSSPGLAPKKFLVKGDFWFFISLTCLVLFFVVPDGWNAGMMSSRIALLTLFAFIIWIGAQTVSKMLLLPSGLFLTFIYFQQLRESYPLLEKGNVHAIEIEKFCGYIKEGKSVAIWNRSDVWNEGHFGDYLGVNNPVLLLDDYEADLPWFPVQWKNEAIPKFMLKEDGQSYPFFWKRIETGVRKQIDYVFVYSFSQNKADGEFMAGLKNMYGLIAQSEHCQLYKLKRSCQ